MATSDDFNNDETNLSNAIDHILTLNDDNSSNNQKSYDMDWLKGTSAEIEMKKTQKKGYNCNDYSHPIYKTISKINGKINNMTLNELVKTLRELKLDPNGKKEVLKKRLKTYQKQLELRRENLLNNNSKSPKKDDLKSFDYICVIDYEATCTEGTQPDYPHEIIEFPVVLINVATQQIEDHFQAYVKPVINPKLSKFCTHLTGITQEQVDAAEEFPQVLEKVNDWFNQKQFGTSHRFAVATDGPWDMENFLNLQCWHSQIEFPYWGKRWIDVRKLFSNWFNVRRCGIEKMLGYLGLQFEGQQHCGLDDARNIARILMKLMSDGCKVSLNSRIKNSRCPLQRNPFKVNNSQMETTNNTEIEMKQNEERSDDDDENGDNDSLSDN